MAAARNESIVRRHSSRRSARRLAPLQNSLMEGVPTGIPEDERLRILLQRCFKRAVDEISNEVEPFREIRDTFLAEGLALLGDTGDDDDRLTKLLKAATERAPADKTDADVAAMHHDQLKSLTAECKRWNELLESDMSLTPPDEECVPEEAEAPPDQSSYYDELVRKADGAKRDAFQYASAMKTLLGMRDKDDCGEASDEVDGASILEDV